LRAWIKCTTYFFFEKVIGSGKENIPADGPVILASNHPNSFLDGLLLTAYYKRPIYYMARGDVFSTPFASALLSFLNIIPIYRKEEGIENLSKNDNTFSFCIDAFKDNGTILIFSEGLSENEWDLRPLRKGTARLAHTAWNDTNIGEKLKILPATINYSSWLKINDVVYLTFAPTIEKKDFPDNIEQGFLFKRFNEALTNKLESECIVLNKEKDLEAQQIIAGFLLKNFPDGKNLSIQAIKDLNSTNEDTRKRYIELVDYIKTNKLRYLNKTNVFVFLLSFLLFDVAFTLNSFPYIICRYISKRTTRFNEFYDSVLYCLLLFIYPVYLALLFIVIYMATHTLIYASGLIALTLITAKLREWAKRNINAFVKRKKLKTVSTMLEGLFQKGNG